MPESPLFQLDYGKIESGWTEVEFHLGSLAIKATVSTCFSETVSGWINAILELCEQAGNPFRNTEPYGKPDWTVVVLHHEPATHTFLMRDVSPFPALPEAQVRIACEYRHDGLSKADAAAPADESWPELDLPMLAVGREVCRASRAVYRAYGLGEFHQRTISNEFPAGALLRLHKLVYPPETLACYASEQDLLSAETISWPASES